MIGLELAAACMGIGFYVAYQMGYKKEPLYQRRPR